MLFRSEDFEAADFGSWKSSYWIGDPTDPDSNAYKTLQGMTERACIAARSLPDYEGPDTACTNPSMTVELQEADGTTGSNCDDPDRTVPCRVVVTMTHTFHLIVPVNIHLFDVTVGFPSDLTFSRTSIFAISDFAIDETP